MALLIELKINKDRKGLDAISLVDKPAILTNFVKLKEDEPTLKFSIANEEQRIVLGPALIPNIKIFRNGKSLGLDDDAYVYFSEETIRELAQIYMEELKIHEVTLDHESDTTDAKMIELWIVEDPQKDKSAIYGFDLAKGTMMVAYKILSEQLWKKIKEGKFNGFSIEASALEMVPKGEFSFSEEESSDERLVLPEEEWEFAISQLKNFGIKQSSLEKLGFMLVAEGDKLTKEGESISYYFAITSSPEESSKFDKGVYAVRYKYVGPRDEKNRTFCAEVLDADLIYRKEDIDMMSFRGENPMSKQNYSIFRYKGSYNCRHMWTRQVYFAADWEDALNNLEIYINSLGNILDYIEKGEETKNSKLIYDKLYKKYEEIKKSLADFKKQGPFGEKGPQPNQIIPSSEIPDNLQEPEYEEEATKVNPRVVKMASEDFTKMIQEIAKTLTESLQKDQNLYDLLVKAYEETKEDIFKECMTLIEKSSKDIVEQLKEFIG